MVLRPIFWLELYWWTDVGLAAVSLRRMAVPSGRWLGVESNEHVGRRRHWSLEAGDRSMDAFIRRSGHCAVASARREGQNAAESFIRAISGDHPRSIRATVGGRWRALEGGKQAGSRLDA